MGYDREVMPIFVDNTVLLRINTDGLIEPILFITKYQMKKIKYLAVAAVRSVAVTILWMTLAGNSLRPAGYSPIFMISTATQDKPAARAVAPVSAAARRILFPERALPFNNMTAATIGGR